MSRRGAGDPEARLGVRSLGARRGRLDGGATARAIYTRIKGRRGHGKAIVATAGKLAVVFLCMLTRGEDYAHQQPSLTRKKIRRLEITAGAPKYTRRAAGIWATNDLMRTAELELALRAETSYKRIVQDQQVGAPGGT